MGYFGYGDSKKDALTSDIFRHTQNNLDSSGKKQKEVYSTLESLCHAWSSEKVPRGRSSSSMFFERGVIYSYGHHYKAAKIYTNKKGEKLVLINSDYYSISTEKHLREIKSATSHIKNIRVPDVDLGGLKTSSVSIMASHGDNLEYLSDLVAKEVALVFQSRSSGNLNRVMELLKKLENYCSFFGIKMPFKMNKETLFLLEECDKLSSQKSYLRNAKRKELETKKELELKIKYADRVKELQDNFPNILAQWLDCEISDNDFKNAMSTTVESSGAFGHVKRKTLSIDISDYKETIKEEFKKRHHESLRAFKAGEISGHDIEYHFYLYGLIDINLSPKYDLLRVKGNKVETSRGADVPLDHAIRLLKMILKNEAKKGERVGLFTLGEVKDDPKGDKTICIGCHKILLSEAKKVLGTYLNN